MKLIFDLRFSDVNYYCFVSQILSLLNGKYMTVLYFTPNITSKRKFGNVPAQQYVSLVKHIYCTERIAHGIL